MADDSPPPRAIVPVIALIVLALAAYFLIQRLHHGAKVETCLWSGRRDCVPLERNDQGR